MVQLFKKISKMIGLPPGTPVHVGEQRTERTKVTIFDYDASSVQEKEIQSVEECFPYKEKPSVTWINIDGISNVDVIEKIDSHFGIHPLVLEDVVNTEQRPKMEDYGDYLFIVLKMIYFDATTKDMMAEQVSILLGSNYVISFQEKEGDVFNVIRERIRQGKGRVRKMGADYLAYSLIDAIVDNYFSILEAQGQDIEDIEDAIMEGEDSDLPRKIHQLKREMIFLRRQIWPLRELISGLRRIESKIIKKATLFYLNDVYDHTIQIIDTIESLRDMVSGLHDIYLSTISNKMNEIMKVLTIIATIFIPLTFLAGIYGMNFEFMPELKWRWGYFALLGIMLCAGLSMLFYFKRKKWI